MPSYTYFCPKCQREVSLVMTISEHDKGTAACPQCGSRDLRAQVETFFAKTSRKS